MIESLVFKYVGKEHRRKKQTKTKIKILVERGGVPKGQAARRASIKISKIFTKKAT